jgi:hypothetical protein
MAETTKKPLIVPLLMKHKQHQESLLAKENHSLYIWWSFPPFCTMTHSDLKDKEDNLTAPKFLWAKKVLELTLWMCRQELYYGSSSDGHWTKGKGLQQVGCKEQTQAFKSFSIIDYTHGLCMLGLPI